MFFRLFPCPIPVGLLRIGSPGRNSPVLVTCNFYLTVRRLIKKLHDLDAWLPGKRGLTKIILPEVVLGTFLAASEMLYQAGFSIWRADIIMAMIMLLIFGTELGGIAATMRSDLDPFLSRLGIGTIGNLSFAGSVRTELLSETRRLTYDRDCCIGCRSCAELCPQGVWNIDGENRAVLAHLENCTACRACLVQCQGGAIKAQSVR